MKKWFLLLIVLWLSLASGCRAALPVSAQTPEETSDLRREIQLLNLINGLELTSEQMRLVLERARQAQEIREGLRSQAAVEEMSAVLGEMRETLMQGENLPPDLTDRYRVLQENIEQLRASAEREIARLALEVEGVLEPHQRYALEHYVPCLIPPEGAERIGQAQDVKGDAALERLRAIPANRYEEHKEAIARRLMERLQKRFHAQGAIPDEEEELARILGLIERARALSDVDFGLQQQALLEELLAPYGPARPPAETAEMIARHLLDSTIIPLLEEKLALAEE